MPHYQLTDPRFTRTESALPAQAGPQQPAANAAPRAPQPARAQAAPLARRGSLPEAAGPRVDPAARDMPTPEHALVGAHVRKLGKPFRPAEDVVAELAKMPRTLRILRPGEKHAADVLRPLLGASLDNMAREELVLLHDNLARPRKKPDAEQAAILGVLREQVAARVATFAPAARRDVLSTMQQLLAALGDTPQRAVLLADLTDRLNDGSVKPHIAETLLQTLPSAKLEDIAACLPAGAGLRTLVTKVLHDRRSTWAADFASGASALMQLHAGAPGFDRDDFVSRIRKAAENYRLHRDHFDAKDRQQAAMHTFIAGERDKLEPHLRKQLRAPQFHLPRHGRDVDDLAASLLALEMEDLRRELLQRKRLECKDVPPPPPGSPDRAVPHADAPDSPLPPPASPDSPLPPPDEIPPPPADPHPGAVTMSQLAAAACRASDMARDAPLPLGGEFLRAVKEALELNDRYAPVRRNTTLVGSMRQVVEYALGTGRFQLGTLCHAERREIEPLLEALDILPVAITPLLLCAQRAERLRRALELLRRHNPAKETCTLPDALMELRAAQTLLDEERVLNASSRAAEVLANVVGDLGEEAIAPLRTVLDGDDVCALASAMREIARVPAIQLHATLSAELLAISRDFAGLRTAIGLGSRLGRWGTMSLAEASKLQAVCCALADAFPFNLDAGPVVAPRFGIASGPQRAALKGTLDQLMDDQAALTSVDHVMVSARLEAYLSAEGARFVLVDARRNEQDLIEPLNAERDQPLAHNLVTRLNLAKATNAQMLAVSRLLVHPAAYLAALVNESAMFLRGPAGQPLVPMRARVQPATFRLRMDNGLLRMSVEYGLQGIESMLFRAGRHADEEHVVRHGHNWARFSLDVAIGAEGERSEDLRYEFDIQRDAWSMEHGRPYPMPLDASHVFGPDVHPQLTQDLLAFAESEYSPENLLFCKAGRDYLAAPSQQGWEEIVRSFVRPNVVNLSHANRDAILKASTAGESEAAITKALQEIRGLVMRDTVPRFLKDPGKRAPEGKA